MVLIPYSFTNIVITLVWILVRILVWKRENQISGKREVQLILVYICIMVVARFTLFPFDKVDGAVQPLVLDTAKWFSSQINWKPLVHLMKYPESRIAWLNLIGNITMFIPLGIVWPAVFPKLDRPWKVLAAGAGFSLCIEIIQLPFYVRVTDVDDLILNTLGYALGYGIYLLMKWIFKRK